MARIKKNNQPQDFSPGEDDFIEDFLDEVEGDHSCGVVEILMDMLETVIINQNPFTVALSEENEIKLLEIYGYDFVDLEVKDGKEVVHLPGAIKKGTKIPSRPISFKEYQKKYLKKKVLNEENQRFILGLVKYLKSKYEES